MSQVMDSVLQIELVDVNNDGRLDILLLFADGMQVYLQKRGQVRWQRGRGVCCGGKRNLAL